MTAEPAPSPGSVLVVDDDDINRMLIIRLATRQGCRAAGARDGLEALRLLRAEPFDVVLLDIEMPGADGHAVLEQMKADGALRDLPVIMISAVDEFQSVVRCIERGAEDFLHKPVDAVLLRARLGACLEKKRLRDLERRKTEELAKALEQLKATQARLVVQEKLASLGALSAGIAHEIKNPLNFIVNFAQLGVEMAAELREELQKQPGLRDSAAFGDVADLLTNLEQNIGKIREHGQRADGVVRSMLLHARGRTGERRPTDLNALLAQAVGLAYHGLRAQNPSFNVTLEADYDGSLGPVAVVAEDLSRVFLNLVNNACYAAHQKQQAAGAGFAPTVVVGTRDRDDRVEIRVRDNGDGVPPAVRDKLFQPFFTTKPPGSGTGLGLSISYEIVVHGHQGDLRVESEEGGFAEFVVTLPKEDPAAPRPQAG
jgi:signal transduction histidine kinase